MNELTGKNMTMRLSRGRRVLREIPVETLNQAAAIIDKMRSDHMERGGGPSTFPLAQIVVGGVVRGHVSWNGRVWDTPSPREWRSGMVPIFDPSAGLVP